MFVMVRTTAVLLTAVFTNCTLGLCPRRRRPSVLLAGCCCFDASVLVACTYYSFNTQCTGLRLMHETSVVLSLHMEERYETSFVLLTDKANVWVGGGR